MHDENAKLNRALQAKLWVDSRLRPVLQVRSPDCRARIRLGANLLNRYGVQRPKLTFCAARHFGTQWLARTK
jgi:hypothetical protein